MAKASAPDASWNPDLASLFFSLVERVLRTESPSILVTRGGADNWVPQPLSLPKADIVELSIGVNFVDDLEEHLSEQQSPRPLLLLPPIMNWPLLPREFRLRHTRRALHEVALTRALDLVPADTRIAALLPVQFFSGETSRSLREALQRHLRLVVEHEHGWPHLHGGRLRMHTAIFQKAGDDGESTDSLLRFFRVPAEVADDSHSLADEVETDLVNLLARKGGPTRWGFVLREGLPLGEPWVYDLYSPQSAELQEDLRQLVGLRPLAELADFPRTVHLAARRGSLLDSDDKDGVPLLEARNIRPSGEISWEQTRYRIRKPGELLIPGDICIRAIWNPATQLVSAQIPHGAPRLAAGHNLIVLRKRTESTNEEWQVLVDYLRSPRAADLMVPRAMGSIHLNQSVLGDLPVPVPDEALRVALRALNEAAADFESWREEAERQKRALFGFPASHEGRIRLLHAGKRAGQRQRAGRSVDDLAFRIRTQYPYPLAYRWRAVEARGKGLEDYQSVLDCAEATLCYLALLGIVGARAQELPIGQLDQIGQRLVKQSRGIGLGDWIAVLREVGKSKRFRNLETFPFPEVPTVLTDEDTDNAVQRLQEARNDLAHGRGPRGAAVPEAIEERCADLEVLLQAVEFVAEYRLRLIEETKWDSLSRLMQIGFRDLMGDHRLVPIGSDEHESSEIETGSVYFLDRAGRYYLARPWLSWRTCPECQRPATFYVERYDSKGDTVTLKSLEHGHAMVDQNVGAVLRRLDFFPSVEFPGDENGL